MSEPDLVITIVSSAELSPALRDAVLALCGAAYGMDFAPFLAQAEGGTHVMAHHAGELVAHAAWIERGLEHAVAGPLRTAYVEAVAAAPAWQGRGCATAVMRRLADEVRARPHYDVAALCAGPVAFYERLGWRPWPGPLGVRTEHGVEATPDEDVMLLRLPTTPPLDESALLTVEWRELEPW
jgi:aminoglycoside 2'-N-acetyltransferase I